MRLSLHPIISDGVIFQKDKPIFIYGNGENDENVYLSFLGFNINQTIKNNEFLFEVPPLSSGENLTLKVYTEKESLEIHNINIGEVILCAGQSNMELALKYDSNYEEYKSYANKKIKYFEVKKEIYPGQESSAFLRQNKWLDYSENNNQDFSAIGFYYGKMLQEKIGGYVGIVSMNYGGTSALSFLSKTRILSGDLQGFWENYIENTRKLNPNIYIKQVKESLAFKETPRYQLFQERLNKGTISSEEVFKIYNSLDEKTLKKLVDNVGPRSAQRPGGLYITMLKKLASFSFSHILYYQGESDAINHTYYELMLNEIIDEFREEFKCSNLPVLIMMLAPFGTWLNENGNNFPYIREIQKKVADEKDGVYVTNIMDDGSLIDIHPKNKLVAAKRFALLAFEKLYHLKNIKGTCPSFESIKEFNDSIELTFKDVDKELIIKDNIKDTLAIKLDGEKIDYKYKKSGKTLNIYFKEQGYDVIEIRYLEAGFIQASIFDESGLPAFPFSIKKNSR